MSEANTDNSSDSAWEIEQLIGISREIAAGGRGECSLLVLGTINLIQRKISEQQLNPSAKPGSASIYGYHQIREGANELPMFEVSKISATETIAATSSGEVGSKEQSIYYLLRKDKELVGFKLWSLHEEPGDREDQNHCSRAIYHPTVDQEQLVDNALTATSGDEYSPPTLRDDLYETGNTRADDMQALQASVETGVATGELLTMLSLDTLLEQYIPDSADRYEKIGISFSADHPNSFSQRIQNLLQWQSFGDQAGRLAITQTLENGAIATIRPAEDCQKFEVNLQHTNLGSQTRETPVGYIACEDVSEPPAAIAEIGGDKGELPVEIIDSFREEIGVKEVHTVNQGMLDGIKNAMRKLDEQENLDSEQFLASLSSMIVELSKVYREQHRITEEVILDIGRIDISNLGSGTFFHAEMIGNPNIKMSVTANKEQDVFVGGHLYECSVSGARSSFAKVTNGLRLEAVDCTTAYTNPRKLVDCVAYRCAEAFTSISEKDDSRYTFGTSYKGCFAERCGSVFVGNKRGENAYDQCFAKHCNEAFVENGLLIGVQNNEASVRSDISWKNCVAQFCSASFLARRGFYFANEYDKRTHNKKYISQTFKKFGNQIISPAGSTKIVPYYPSSLDRRWKAKPVISTGRQMTNSAIRSVKNKLG